MKFLRDNSGHVLILRSPFSMWSRTATAEKTPVTPAPRPAVVATPAGSAVTSHCCFMCQSCASPILLPHDQMGLPFANPSVRRIEVRTVAAVCGSCRHIANYSLFRGCPGFDTRHKLMPAPTAGTTLLVEWLQCDASGCPYKVPLFANFDSDLFHQDGVTLTANWVWQNLKCIAGHRIHRTSRPNIAKTPV